ncbi:SGNH hydrolase-type esterase domain-containing protein [Aspergillus californicus]
MNLFTTRVCRSPSRVLIITSRWSSRQSLSTTSTQHEPSNPGTDTLRLMPLGGSITHGVGSSTGTGYRKRLLTLLQSHGLPIKMVGSRQTGIMSNNNHEGWRGSRIDEIHHKIKNRKSKSNSISALSPHIFAINAGSNDCLQRFSIETAGARMAEMLEFLWAASPGSTILLSTLLVNGRRDVDEMVRGVNGQFRRLYEEMVAERRRIVLVDMHSPDGPQQGHLVDGTHPGDEGYEIMAGLWCRGVLEARGKGFFE